MKTMMVAVVVASTLVSATATQTKPGTGSVGPAAMDRLPGDDVPPPASVQLQARPGRLAGPLDALDRTPGPKFEQALTAARAALGACSALGVRIGVAVVDSEGYIKVGLTADGARPGRIYFATRKALVAVSFGAPSSVVQARLRDDAAGRRGLGPAMVAVPGGVPLRIGGRLLGAIGVSGASGEQDEACASAGAQAVSGD